MPSVGNRASTTNMGRGYAKDPIRKYAEEYKNLCESMLHEAGIDVFSEPYKAMMLKSTDSALKNYFVEGVAQLYQPEVEAGIMSHEELEDLCEDAEEMYLNDREAILENAALGAVNPVIGMTFPIHKNIMMNNVFDNGGIPKFVAREPKFTLSMEQRILTTPAGEEIDFYKEQYKLTAAIDSTAPFTEIEMTLPIKEVDNQTNANSYIKVGGTAVTPDGHGTPVCVTAIGGQNGDNISIESYISEVYVPGVYYRVGDYLPDGTYVDGTTVTAGSKDLWYPAVMKFTPAYGEYDRQIMEGFHLTYFDSSNVEQHKDDVIAGYVKKNVFVLSSTNGAITKVKLKARLDTSSANLPTCSVSWKVRTDIVEIPEAIPINTTVSPEEVKDISALYQVNQLSKILSLVKSVLGNYKDDKIKAFLDESFMHIPSTQKLAGTFDFAPRAGYALDHVEWRRKTFMDALDTHVTYLLQVLNDPNMTISVFGRPDLIRKITPTEYTYETPANIGPATLDFKKTVVSSDSRVYQFISSDKLRDNNNMIVVLCPKNTDRIVYRIYDYQMYVSNEIRNAKNPALPAIHAFERFKTVEYQPVQGRLQILNPTGLRSEVPNTNPIGTSDYNDYTANAPYQA